MKLFFDFDGTLVNVFKRDYELYKRALRGRDSITYEEYTQRRRNNESSRSIVSLTVMNHEEFYPDFIAERHALTERSELLTLDTLFDGVQDVLTGLSKHPMFIISARNNHQTLTEQCKALKIDHHFRYIHAIASSDKSPILKALSGGEIAIMIGDTEFDVESAKAAGVISVAVSSGIRSRTYLQALQPDHLIDNIKQLQDIISHVDRTSTRA